MLKYIAMYESVSVIQNKTFIGLLGMNLVLLKMLLVFAKLALLSSGLK
jgi:hypothetical protein